MAESKKKSKKNDQKKAGLIAGVVIGAVAIVAVVVVYCVMAINASKINTITDFKNAVIDKRAMDCVITHEDEGEFTLQTSKGFDKVKLVAKEDDSVQHILSIKDDMTYMWDNEGNAYKMEDSTLIDDFIDEITTAAEEDGGEEEDESYTFVCSEPKDDNFDLPEDLEFVDISDLL